MEGRMTENCESAWDGTAARAGGNGVSQVAVSADDGECRLDRWFRRHYPDIAFGRLQKMLRKGEVRVDGKRVKADTRLLPGQVVRVPPHGPGEIPEEGQTPPRQTPPRQTMPRQEDVQILRKAVLYQDRDMLVLNKPAGWAVQGGSGTSRHVDGLLPFLVEEGADRPRLVHRLDKDTTGLLVVALTASAAARLTEAFRGKAAKKRYWALTAGVPVGPQYVEKLMEAPLGKRPGKGGEKMEIDPQNGKEASTIWQKMGFRSEGSSEKPQKSGPGKKPGPGRKPEPVRKPDQGVCWLELSPLTGRTHQLRVHCAELLGTPILGDGKYGGAAAHLKQEGLARQLHLHARFLTLPHPSGGEISFTAPLPDHMEAAFALFGFEVPDQDEPVMSRSGRKRKQADAGAN